jgi:hypothetical protein
MHKTLYWNCVIFFIKVFKFAIILSLILLTSDLFFEMFLPLHKVSTLPVQNEKIAKLKQEYKNFLVKYESNSCIMGIFSNSEKSCEDLNDQTTAQLAFKMTICVYSSLGKEINLNCDSINFRECIQELKGDAWTTFITFSHHIDNLCFYFRTLAWEKSSEFLFYKMLNSSVSVLTEINQSYLLAEKMFSTQEKFSLQMEENLADTLKNYQTLNQFLDNYTQVENKVKQNMQVLEEKILYNNQQIINTVKYVDEKFQTLKFILEFFNTKNDSYSFIYFTSLYALIWFLTFFETINGIKIYLYFLIISFFLFEKFILLKYEVPIYDLGVIYFNIIFYCFRVVYLMIVIATAFIRHCFFNKNLNTNIKDGWTEYKNLLSLTPMWMKKYFNKIKIQNEYLIEKFQTMEELMERERNKIKKLALTPG